MKYIYIYIYIYTRRAQKNKQLPLSGGVNMWKKYGNIRKKSPGYWFTCSPGGAIHSQCSLAHGLRRALPLQGTLVKWMISVFPARRIRGRVYCGYLLTTKNMIFGRK